MAVDIVYKNANFLFDRDGVMIVTSIENAGIVIRGELIYDGKNTAVLNRNNKEFFGLKNIAPMVREKLKKSEYVTIIEQNNKELYSYDVVVHFVLDLGLPDDWNEYQEKVTKDLQAKLSPEELQNLSEQSEYLLKELSK